MGAAWEEGGEGNSALLLMASPPPITPGSDVNQLRSWAGSDRWRQSQRRNRRSSFLIPCSSASPTTSKVLSLEPLAMSDLQATHCQRLEATLGGEENSSFPLAYTPFIRSHLAHVNSLGSQAKIYWSQEAIGEGKKGENGLFREVKGEKQPFPSLARHSTSRPGWEVGIFAPLWFDETFWIDEFHGLGPLRSMLGLLVDEDLFWVSICQPYASIP